MNEIKKRFEIKITDYITDKEFLKIRPDDMMVEILESHIKEILSDKAKVEVSLIEEEILNDVEVAD